MKQYLTTLLILFFLNPSFGQKKIEIPENDVVYSLIEKMPEYLDKFHLKNLQTSTDSINIRIWKTHEIFTISYNGSFSSDYKIHTTSNEPILSIFNFSENVSNIILDSLFDNRIMELQDEKFRGIDGSFVFFEISTKNKYKVVSFWSPNAERGNDCKYVVRILDMLNKIIHSKELRNEFLNSLEPGVYRWGMTSIQIDGFLSEDTVKTDFYSKAEERIKTELNIAEETNRWEYPLVIINDKIAKIADLNQYTNKEVERLDILKPDNQTIALYGANGSNGIIILKTKL